MRTPITYDVLVTHKNCMDGTGAMLAMRRYCTKHNLKAPTVVYMQYGDVLPDLTGKHVLMTDFSLTWEKMHTLNAETASLMVLDHHASAEKELEGLDFCKFDMSKSGAVLTWEYLVPDEEVPELLLYIQDRDLWTWQMEDSKEVSAGVNLMPPAYWIDESLTTIFADDTIAAIKMAGKSVLHYQDLQVMKVAKRTIELPVETLFTIDGHKVPCITSTHLISEIGNILSEGKPFSAQYFMTEDSIVFSLRSQPAGEDVSVIAAKYGGGGHPRAAGFSFKFEQLDLNILFQDRNLEKAILPVTITDGTH